MTVSSSPPFLAALDTAFFTLQDCQSHVIAKLMELNLGDREISSMIASLERGEYLAEFVRSGEAHTWLGTIGSRRTRIFGRLTPEGFSITSPAITHDRDLPLDAEFLFYLFLDTKTCDALVGDLEERYRLIHEKFGARRANFWYWTQAIRSVGPIAWAWGKKVVLKPVLTLVAWMVAKGFVAHDSWLAALVEIWKRIRS